MAYAVAYYPVRWALLPDNEETLELMIAFELDRDAPQIVLRAELARGFDHHVLARGVHRASGQHDVLALQRRDDGGGAGQPGRTG